MIEFASIKTKKNTIVHLEDVKYTVHNYSYESAKLFGLPENCTPESLDFDFSIESFKWSLDCEFFHTSQDERLSDLIAEQLFDEILEQYSSDER